MAGTPGERLYLIRLACGDGVRTPETLKDFSARLKRAAKASYSPMQLSLLERMGQKWKLDDVRVFASVDPLRRGEGWLAFNLPPEAKPEEDKPTSRAAKKA